MGFPGAQTIKCLLTMWETQVRSLGWEDPLEKEMATHSSTLASRMEEPRGLQSTDVLFSKLSASFYIPLASYEGSNFSTSLSALDIICLS